MKGRAAVGGAYCTSCICGEYLITYVCVLSLCSKVPAFLNIVDIAGLVKGASEGQGLGNAFLSHIKSCDAIFHMCSKYILHDGQLPNYFWVALSKN